MELFDLLTERQIDVLRLLSQGRSNEEIASFLCIAEHTVECHTRNIYKRLGVSNRAEASTLHGRWQVQAETLQLNGNLL